MKLSIVTINRNNAEGLRRTLDSVADQTNKEFEHIVIDGASTDESVDVIKEYVKQCLLYNVLWVSEPDTGIYNAMNKGVRKAKGEYVLMLNSGDYFVDEHVIEQILPELHEEDIIQGNVIEDLPDKQIRNRGYGRSNINFIDALGGYFLHQAAFIKKSVHDVYGYYDESYRKNADTYFFINALAFGNATFRYIDIDIANFDMTGISNDIGSEWQRIGNEENKKWYGENVSQRMMDLYKAAPFKMQICDSLRQYKWIWFLGMGLVRLSEWLTPVIPQIKKEEIKSKV